MCYDAFAHLPLYMLEDLGSVAHGESGAFVASGATRPGDDAENDESGEDLA